MIECFNKILPDWDVTILEKRRHDNLHIKETPGVVHLQFTKPWQDDVAYVETSYPREILDALDKTESLQEYIKRDVERAFKLMLER